jgi:hypothetical protein
LTLPASDTGGAPVADDDPDPFAALVEPAVAALVVGDEVAAVVPLEHAASPANPSTSTLADISLPGIVVMDPPRPLGHRPPVVGCGHGPVRRDVAVGSPSAPDGASAADAPST